MQIIIKRSARNIVAKFIVSVGWFDKNIKVFYQIQWKLTGFCALRVHNYVTLLNLIM